MANQGCFGVAVGCLLLLLTSGASAPVGAESHSPTDVLEFAAYPPPRDDLGLITTPPEPAPGAGGSAVATEPASEELPLAEPPVASVPEEPGLPARPAEPPAPPPSPSRPAAQPAPTPIPPAAAPAPEPPSYSVIVTPQVAAFIDRFTGVRRDVVGLWLNRSRRYLGMIREVFRKHGLPEDLAFVAMIESGFNPLAVSRAGAKGLWQFMADTARRYGLRVDQWVDERYDAEKSTVAAAAYLRDLYRQFGSWTLAKAAYNAGEMTIVQAIRAVGSTDFWTLARSRFLRQETKEFVPAIHAATVIGRDPARFGFEPVESPPPRFETVTVPPATSLARLAQDSGVSLDALRELNAVLIRGVTPPGAPYELRIPPGAREEILAALGGPGRRVLARADRRGAPRAAPPADGIHVVRPRETVTSIARRYGLAVSDVLRWNGLDADDLIRPGDRLRVADVRVAQRAAASRLR